MLPVTAMLSEEILSKVRHTDYWEMPYEEWGVDTWDSFYSEKYSNESKESKRKSRSTLAVELEVLIKHLKPGTKECLKALALSRKLVSIF